MGPGQVVIPASGLSLHGAQPSARGPPCVKSPPPCPAHKLASRTLGPPQSLGPPRSLSGALLLPHRCFGGPPLTCHSSPPPPPPRGTACSVRTLHQTWKEYLRCVGLWVSLGSVVFKVDKTVS